MLTTNIGSNATYSVGNYYELTGSEITKYYYAGSQRVAMRKNNVLSYILGDHLGSTNIVTDANGAVTNETKYKAWGETRYSSGSEQTKYGYTGQYSYVSDFGLHFYNARWYDSSLGRFAQADTIVPDAGSSEQWDRYSYTTNNPLRYTDSSGHCAGSAQDSTNPDLPCWILAQEIESSYNVEVDEKNFTTDELSLINNGFKDVTNVIGQENASILFEGWEIKNKTWGLDEWLCGEGCTNPITKTITFYDSFFDYDDSEIIEFGTIHEIGHVFDSRKDIHSPSSLGTFKDTFWTGCTRFFAKCLPFGFDFEGVSGLPVSEYAKTSSAEDYAETFAYTIWSKNNKSFSTIFKYGIQPPDPDRLNYMDKELLAY